MNTVWDRVDAVLPYLLGAMLVAAVVPIWMADWLPLREHGLFLAHLDIAWRLDDPSTAYSGRFVGPDGATPQSLTVWFARIFGPLFGTISTAKFLLSIAVVGLPMSALVVARRLGRSPWVAVPVLPLAWGAIMRVGLVDLALGLPLALLAVSGARRLVERPGISAAGALVLLHVLAFYAHIAAFIAAWVLSLAVLLSTARLRHALTMAPLWVLSLPLAGFAIARGLDSSAVQRPIERQMAAASEAATGFFSDSWDEWVLVVTIIAWLVAMLGPSGSRSRSGQLAPEKHASVLADHIPEGLTFVCAIAYLAAPTASDNPFGHIGYGAATLALVFFWMWPRPVISGTSRRLLATAVWGAAVAYIVVVNIRIFYFERYTVDRLEPLIASVPDGARLAVATQLHGAWPTGGMAIAGLHAGMHAVHNGGVTHRLMASRPTAAIRFASGAAPPAFAPSWIASESLYEFDYIVVDTADSVDAVKDRRGVEEIDKIGPWRLYRISPKPADVTFVMPSTPPNALSAPVWNSECPKRYRLVGFKATRDPLGLKRIKPMCRRYTGKKASPKSVGAKALGEGGGRDESITCARGSEVVGLYGLMGARVESLGIRCKESFGAKSQDSVGESSGVSRIGRPFDLRCPAETHARGLRARAGYGLWTVGLICGR